MKANKNISKPPTVTEIHVVPDNDLDLVHELSPDCPCRPELNRTANSVLVEHNGINCPTDSWIVDILPRP